MTRFFRWQWLLGSALIAFLAFWSVRELLQPGLLTGHDSESHIVRQIAFEDAWRDGQFPVVWAARPFQGLGSPVLMLNYQLPYYFTEMWRLMGFSLYESFHLTLLVTFVASGVIAFLVFGNLFGWLAGTVGALVYLFAPYRFTDIFVRAALGEAVSFLFPPLLLWTLEKRKKVFGALAWAGMFLTHPVGSALCSGFFLGYALLRSWQESSWKTLRWFALTFSVGLLLASWNLVPTLFLTKYTHYSPENSKPLKHFPSWEQLTVPDWGYGYSTEDYEDEMPFQIGVAQWLVIGFCFITIVTVLARAFVVPQARIFSRESRFWGGAYALVLTLTAIIFMLPESARAWELFRVTNIIDFPWRILMAVVFGSAFLAAWLISQRVLLGSFTIFLATMVSVLAIYGTRNYHQLNAHWPWSQEHYYEQGPDGDAYGEYASLYRKTRQGTKFASRVEFIEGEGKFEIQTNKSNVLAVRTQSTQETILRLNSMYFPGWKVYLDGAVYDPRGTSPCSISADGPEEGDTSGLIVCHLSAGEHEVRAQYELLPVQKWGLLLSLAGTGVIAWWSFPLFFQHLMKQSR